MRVRQLRMRQERANEGSVNILPATVSYEDVGYPTAPYRTGKTTLVFQNPISPRNAPTTKNKRENLTAKKSPKRNVGMFPKGNQAAAKDKWSLDRIRKFQSDLMGFRVMLGYNYSEMGRALGFSGSYIKLLEGGYPSEPLRQPSEKFVRQLDVLKATAVRSKKIKLPRGVVKHIDVVFSHILGKRFKCPVCAKLVKAKKLDSGLEYWWAKVPGQKHCPKHIASRRRALRSAGRT